MLRLKRGRRFMFNLKEKIEKINNTVSHPLLAGYPKYIHENPDELNAEYYLVETSVIE